jgi:acetyltransferase-like isoleucine patch superfamily enzyme
MHRLKALIGVFVVVAFFYLAWKILPPYIEEYQFQQEIQSIARNNEYTPLDENGIRDQVKRQITEIGVPVSPENVVIQKNGTDVTIGTNYTVHIDAVLYPFDLTFHPATKNGQKIDPVPSAPNQ